MESDKPMLKLIPEFCKQVWSASSDDVSGWLGSLRKFRGTAI